MTCRLKTVYLQICRVGSNTGEGNQSEAESIWSVWQCQPGDSVDGIWSLLSCQIQQVSKGH